MKRLLLGILVVTVAFTLPPISLAQHQHGASGGGTMKMDTREVLIEGIKVVFQIMPNEDHMKMLAEMKMEEKPETGSTHNISIVLIDAGTRKEITDAQVKMKVIDPAGEDQIKTLKAQEMMKSYDSYFNLSQKGKYQILTSFRIGEKTRNAGIYYEIE